MDKVAGLVSITEGADRTGDIDKNSGQSFLGGEDVVNHFPDKRIIPRLQAFDAG